MNSKLLLTLNKITDCSVVCRISYVKHVLGMFRASMLRDYGKVKQGLKRSDGSHH